MTNSELKILMVIARDDYNRIIFRVANAGTQEALPIAMSTALEILREQKAAARVEVHNFESTSSLYKGMPLAVFTVDDMTNEECKQRGE